MPRKNKLRNLTLKERKEKVAGIKKEISAGKYETEKPINQIMDDLLKLLGL